MKVVLHTNSGEAGTLRLDGSNVVADSPAGESVLQHNVIVEPDTLVKLTPDKGERYLRAVPANLNGTYFWASIEEDT
jgi:hypothetical protein